MDYQIEFIDMDGMKARDIAAQICGTVEATVELLKESDSVYTNFVSTDGGWEAVVISTEKLDEEDAALLVEKELEVIEEEIRVEEREYEEKKNKTD